jgi:hypothetical protein
MRGGIVQFFTRMFLTKLRWFGRSVKRFRQLVLSRLTDDLDARLMFITLTALAVVVCATGAGTPPKNPRFFGKFGDKITV